MKQPGYPMGERLQIKVVFGYANGQPEIDALLKLVPAGRDAGLVGGAGAAPGTAFLAIGPKVPPPIWYVIPTARIAPQSSRLFRQALEQGLRCAEQHGFKVIGLLMDAHALEFSPPAELLPLILTTLRGFSRSAAQVHEIRIYASDSRLLASLGSLLDPAVRDASLVCA